MCVCVDARLILVLVLGRQIVYGQKTVYLCLTIYIVFEKFLKTNTRTAQLRPANHPHIATAASDTEGVAAVSCMESHMNRGPLGSIDPNSIRETELDTECRRRRERESLNSRQHDRRGMLLVRGLPLRVGGRHMRHGRKGCGRTDKEMLRGASRRQHKRERRGVSPARVGCLQTKCACKRVFAASSS